MIKILNKKKEQIAETFVDEKHYDYIINNCNLWLTNGYVQVNDKIAKKRYYLHRYVYYILEKNTIDEDNPIIDHINSNKLDNRLSNLRSVNSSQNSKNKSKKQDSASKYYGTYLDKKTNKWFCKVKINEKYNNYSYDIEEWAAYHYDLLVKELDDYAPKINNIAKPDGFIKKKNKLCDTTLPIGLTKKNNKYVVQIKGKYGGIFTTIEEAQNRYNYLKEQNIKETKTIDIVPPIARNSDGFAILYAKTKKEDIEIIVDDNLYYDLIKINWNINSAGYAKGKVCTKLVRMHRYVINYTGKDVVDHINNNRLDNRLENLRVVTRSQNSQNMSFIKNTSSKYVGVSKNKKTSKYEASIKVNGKKIYLGHFTEEVDAAKARDKATLKYFTHGKLNFEIEN